MRKKKNTIRGILKKDVPLNMLALGIAVSGFLIPLFTQSPLGLADGAKAMLAGSGATLSADVPPNPYNTLADQLHQKEQELNDREAALNARETPPSVLNQGNIFGFISFILSLMLCILIALNFYLDSRRGRRRGLAPGKYSVDLS
jgi:hypothetical protein